MLIQFHLEVKGEDAQLAHTRTPFVSLFTSRGVIINEYNTLPWPNKNTGAHLQYGSCCRSVFLLFLLSFPFTRQLSIFWPSQQEMFRKKCHHRPHHITTRLKQADADWFHWGALLFLPAGKLPKLKTKKRETQNKDTNREAYIYIEREREILYIYLSDIYLWYILPTWHCCIQTRSYGIQLVYTLDLIPMVEKEKFERVQRAIQQHFYLSLRPALSKEDGKR